MNAKDPHHRDRAGRTPLHYAVLDGPEGSCNDWKLADPVERERARKRAAEFKCANVERLLSDGADVNALEDDNWTALHFAARTDSPEVVELLLDSGADINAINGRGETPILIAVAHTKGSGTGVLRLLRERGADPFLKGVGRRFDVIDYIEMTERDPEVDAIFADLLAEVTPFPAPGASSTTPQMSAAATSAETRSETGAEPSDLEATLGGTGETNAWEQLRRTPIDEVRRRAAIVDRWNDIESVDVPGGIRYAWNDGGGQSSGWFFADDGQVLLLTYEHEGALNFYSDDYAAQSAVFGGVPAELVALVANRPASYEFVNVTDPATGNALPHASGVFWFDGTVWHVAAGLIDYCERHDIDLFDGTRFSRDVGFDYAVGDCQFGQEFTPETVIAKQIEDGWYEEPGEKEAALERLRDVFENYRRAT